MKNHWSCWIMSYPQGNTSHNFHLTTIHKNTSLSSLGESRLLTYLLYHVLEVNNHFHSTIKINLLQLKNTYISDILWLMNTFLGDSPTCWHHSLILRYESKNSHLSEQTHFVFSTYHSKFFLLILLSLHLIKHYWSFSCHWHICFMSTVKVKTQTRFMVLFTSRSLLTWGKSPSASPGISPRYLPAIYL